MRQIARKSLEMWQPIFSIVNNRVILSRILGVVELKGVKSSFSENSKLCEIRLATLSSSYFIELADLADITIGQLMAFVRQSPRAVCLSGLNTDYHIRIPNVLSKYQIHLQVLSVISDNGSNMIKSTAVLSHFCYTFYLSGTKTFLF